MHITPLSRSEYEYFELHYTYTAKEHYVPFLVDEKDVFSVAFRREALPIPYHHESYDAMCSDWKNSEAFGISEREGEKPVGYLEVWVEDWNARLRICNLLIDEQYRGRGFGTALIEHAKALAAERELRCVVLETQSCNVPAIDFYRRCGFRFAGTNLFFYSNDDIREDEVMLEMACLI